MKRAILKTLSYRAVGSGYAFVAGLLITGRWELALALAGGEAVTKSIAFFLHEWVWESRFLKCRFA